MKFDNYDDDDDTIMQPLCVTMIMLVISNELSPRQKRPRYMIAFLERFDCKSKIYSINILLGCNDAR